MSTDPTPVSPVSAAVEVVLHEQRLSVTAARVATERVVLRRRLVSEVRQVEVTVQREELEVLRLPIDAHPATAQSTRTGAPAAPLVILLSEQVPVVQLRTRPYEQVTVTVDVITVEQQLHEQVDREQVDITQHLTTAEPR